MSFYSHREEKYMKKAQFAIKILLRGGDRQVMALRG
jgi:hypothetical protein